MAALSEARVLVTGASGFIGSHLCRRLVAERAEVHALTSAVSSVFPERLLDIRESIRVHEANVTDRSAMVELARTVRPSLVFHLAAYTHVGKSWQRVDECIQTNIQGTVNLLKALEPVGYDRFVNMGTSEIYGDIDVPYREDAQVNPCNPYSVSKYAAERYCRMLHQQTGQPIVLARPSSAYGPAQSPDRIVPETIVRALGKQELKTTSGRQTRELNYVEDLAEGIVMLAVKDGIEGQIFNIGCGEDVAVRDIVNMILDLMGNPIEAEIGALPDRPNEIWRMYSDSSRARELLRWSPRHTLREGLEKTIEWYRAELSKNGSSFDA